MTNVFACAQVGYGWYEDGTETESTLIGSEDTAPTRLVVSDSNIQLRVQIQESGAGAISGATTDDYQLTRSINGGAFANVTTTSTAVKVHTASALTDGGNTTARLTAGAGAFVAGRQDDANGIADNVQLTANNYTEHVFGLTLVAAELNEGDVLTLRLLLNGALFTAIAGGAYTVTPTINITKAVSATANTSTGTTSITGQTPSLTVESFLSVGVAATTVTGLAPTVSADANMASALGTTPITGLVPTVDVGGGALQERLTPNTRLAGGTNLKDTLTNSPPTRFADIDEPTGEDDGEWWTAVDPEADIDIRLGFPTSSGTLTGTQTLRVLIRGTSIPCRQVTVELWESGTKLTSENTDPVTSTDGQIVTVNFEPAEVTDQTGAGVEIRIFATAA